MKTKVNLCMCNDCGDILIDTNQQTGAKEYEVEINKYKELVLMEDTTEFEHGDWMKACPNCKTDGYLSDEIDETKL